MAITTSEQTAILELVVLMFDAAPGATYLPLINAEYEAHGHSLPALANFLDDTGAFLALHPANESPAAFAASFLAPLGLENDAFAVSFITSKFPGTSKADIAVLAYNALHTLPAGAAAQYVAAKAIMENKAEVAAHYSITLGGNATGLTALQAVLDGVTASDASVAAAIDALDDALASGPALTSGHDAINVTGTAATNVTGTVDGDADGHTGTGTLNENDSVTGNGNTNLVLTVKETGDAPTSTLTHLESVFLASDVAGDITFDAAGWSDVGSVVVNGGVDGLHVVLDNLDAGTGVVLDGVTGSFDVSYNFGDGVTASLRNATAGATSSLELQANGDLDAMLGDDALAVLDSDASLGDVAIDAGDGVTFIASLQSEAGDLDLGNVSATAGDDATISLLLLEAAGDASIGEVEAILGDGADLTLHVEDVTGAVVVGNVFIYAQQGASLSAELREVGGNLTVGDVSMIAASGDGTVLFAVDEILGAVDLGSVTVAADGPSIVRATLSGTSDTVAGALTVDSIAVQAGGPDSDASLLVSDFSAVQVGDITVTAGDGSPVEAAIEAVSGNVLVGDVTVTGGGSTTVEFSVGDVEGDVTAGFVHAATTNGSTLSVSLDDVAGAITIAGMAVEAGATAAVDVAVAAATGLTVGNATLTIGNEGELQAGLSSAAGNLSVGQVLVGAGESAVIDVEVALDAPLLGTAVGTYSVAGVDLQAAQDALVTINLQQSLQTVVTGEGASLGDFSAGPVELLLGDNATVALDIAQRAQVATSNFTDGDFNVGDIAISVSATTDIALAGNSNIDISILKSATPGAGTGGNFTVGDVDLAAGDNADMRVDIVYDGSFEQMGAVNVGEITLLAGDDANIVNARIHVGEHAAGDLGAFNFAGATVLLGDDSDASIDIELQKWGNAGDIGNITIGDFDLQAGESSDVSVDFDVFGITEDAVIGDLSIGNILVSVGDDGSADFSGLAIPAAFAQSAGDLTLGTVTAVIGEGANFAYGPAIAVQTTLGEVTAGAFNLTAGEGATFQYGVDVAGDSIGEINVGDWNVVAGAEAAGALLLEADGTLVGVTMGAITLDLAQSASVTARVELGGADEVGAVTVGNITVTADDGALATVEVEVSATDASAGMTLGDIVLTVEDLAVTTGGDDELEVGGAIHFTATFDGEDDDVLTLGDIMVDVAGTADADEVWVQVTSNGDVVIGNITVGGSGTFILDGEAHNGTLDLNTSFLAIDAAGEVTIGNVDFSEYENDITLDLTWVDHGAGSITGGQGNDMVLGTVGNNTLAGSVGVDVIDASQGGVDTIVTSQGDSGKTAVTLDSVTGFVGGTAGAGDKLDFNLEAGTAANYVEGTGGTDFAQFISHANNALNTTVKYFAEVVGGNMLVAVNYGSGEADMVVQLTGVTSLSSLSFQNFVA